MIVSINQLHLESDNQEITVNHDSFLVGINSGLHVLTAHLYIICMQNFLLHAATLGGGLAFAFPFGSWCWMVLDGFSDIVQGRFAIDSLVDLLLGLLLPCEGSPTATGT